MLLQSFVLKKYALWRYYAIKFFLPQIFEDYSKI